MFMTEHRTPARIPNNAIHAISITYACYDSVLHPVPLISLLLSIRYSIIKIPLKFRDFKENRQYFLLFDRWLLIMGKPQE